MDELLKEIGRNPDVISNFTYTQFIFALVLATVLSTLVGLVYKMTHTGLAYSRSFTITMVAMSITICFIMLIIGSNLARAFSLVGALSIIRYRNAVKESRDTAYIFLAMAIGMACGTKLFGMGVIFTFFASAILFLFEYVQFGSVNRQHRLLQVSGPSGSGLFSDLESAISKFAGGRYTLISTEIHGEDKTQVFNIEVRASKLKNQSLDEHFSPFAKDLNIKVLTGFERFNV